MENINTDENDAEDIKLEGASLEQMMVECLEEIDQRISGDNLRSSGFRDFDSFGEFGKPGEVTVVAGVTGIGQLEFAINSSFFRAKSIVEASKGFALGIYSTNSTNQSIFDKLVSAEGRIEISKLKKGDLNEDEQDRLMNVSRYLSTVGGNIYLSTTRCIDKIVKEIKSIADNVDLNRSIFLISEIERVSGDDVPEKLKNLALDSHISIVVTKTLHPKISKRPDKRPRISDIDDFNLMIAADKIVFVYRDDYYNPQSENEGIAEILFSKNSDGKTGSFRLVWQPEYNSFFDFKSECEASNSSSKQ